MSTTTEDLDGRMWANVPGLNDLTAALGAVRTRLAGTTGREPAAPHVGHRRIVDALLAGHPLPEDLGRRLYEEDLAGQYLSRERHGLVQMQQDIGERIAATHAAHADEALAVLDAELLTVLDAVRELEPALHHVSTADDAVRVGGDAVAAWTRLADLVAWYRRIRGLQINTTVDVLGDRHLATALIERAGRYANLTDHQPMRAYLADGSDVPASEPPYAEGPTHLRWLARPDVAAWVPGVHALQDADAAAIDARLQADRQRATQRKGKPRTPFTTTPHVVTPSTVSSQPVFGGQQR